jgi:hypothetical protein
VYSVEQLHDVRVLCNVLRVVLDNDARLLEFWQQFTGKHRNADECAHALKTRCGVCQQSRCCACTRMLVPQAREQRGGQNRDYFTLWRL